MENDYWSWGTSELIERIGELEAELESKKS